jgi:Barrel-sandwich domain of CusB or HlyD membrane-fusion
MSRNKVSSDLTKIHSPDPQLLAEQICTILTDENLSSKEKNGSLLQLTVGLVGGVAAVFYKQEEDGLRSLGQLLSPQAASLSSDVLAEMQKGAAESLHKKKSTILPLAMAVQAHIFSCPVFSVYDDVPCCLSVLILPENKAPEPFLVVLQLMAVAMAQVRSSSHHIPGSLVQLLGASGKPIDSLRTFSDVTRQSSGCILFAVGSSNSRGKIRLEHVSNVVTVDARTDQARRYVKVMQEAANRKKVSVWPAISGESSFEESLLVKELVQANGLRQGAAVPLMVGGQITGILILLWSERLNNSDVLQEILETTVFSGLFVRNFSKKGGMGHLPNAEEKTPLKRKIITVLIIFALFGIALFPKEFVLHPTAIAKPVQVRYVVARFDGLLQKVFAEPGDRVKKEMELALLDGRELELELRTIRADSAKSLKIRDNYMAVGKVAEAQIALLESKRLRERESLLLGRQRELSLKSPFDGIVLRGDLKQSEGGPVAKGEVLFEVAPLERILLQLLVADEDIAHVQKGLSVDVRFDAFPGKQWKGVVARIAPQSTLVQSENVFLVSFEIENSDGVLLPGMQGYASVYCGKKRLLWIYFHKPWYALRQLLVSLF